MSPSVLSSHVLVILHDFAVMSQSGPNPVPARSWLCSGHVLVTSFKSRSCCSHVHGHVLVTHESVKVPGERFLV